jgi:hypothetical protein
MIQGADAVLVIVSKDTNDSQWIDFELAQAIRAGKPLVPVVVDRNARIPAMLAPYAGFDATTGDATDLASRLQVLADRRGPRQEGSRSETAAALTSLKAASRQVAMQSRAEAASRTGVRLATVGRLVLVTVLLVGCTLVVALASSRALATTVQAASVVIAAIVGGLSGLAFGDDSKPHLLLQMTRMLGHWVGVRDSEDPR